MVSDSYEPDVGVLVVHGIGSQTKASTLRGFVDPLMSHLDHQLKRWGQPVLAPADCDDNEPVAVIDVPKIEDLPAQRWLVREAHWAEAFDAPSRSETARWLGSVGPWFVYFFIVRLWLRFGLNRLQAAIGVAIAAAAVSSILAARANRGADALILLGATALGVLVVTVVPRAGNSPAAALVIAGTVVVLYPIAAFLTIGIVGLAVLSLLPIPGASWLRALQTALAASVGDAYAVVANPRRERAMRDVIRCALEGLATEMGEAKPVVLICHSQGAALTYRLLRNEWPDLLIGRKVTFVTYGSAIIPIHVLERRHQSTAGRRLRSMISSFVGLISLILLAVLLGRAAALASTPWWLWALCGVGGAWASLVVLRDARCLDGAIRAGENGILGSKTDNEGTGNGIDKHESIEHLEERISGFESAEREKKKEEEELTAIDLTTEVFRVDDCHDLAFVPGLNANKGGLRWIDIYAVWDPVPNGPLLLSAPRAIPVDDPGRNRTLVPVWRNTGVVLPETYPVANDHQPWLDHVTYRTNAEEVVGRFAVEIAALATPSTADLSALTYFEHGAARGREDDQLVNPAAETARRDKTIRGNSLYGGQLAALLVAVAAVSLRQERLTELGHWARSRLPAPLLSLLSGILDLVPEGIRDFFAGDARDPSHSYGVVLVVVAVVAILFLQFVVVRAWQSRATELFSRGPETPGLIWKATPLLVLAVASLFPFLAGVLSEGEEVSRYHNQDQRGGRGRVPKRRLLRYHKLRLQRIDHLWDLSGLCSLPQPCW